MTKGFIFISLLILFSGMVLGENYIQVESVTIGSFGGVVESSNGIYVGSTIRYEIKLLNKNESMNQQFQVVIVNPSQEVIENQTFDFSQLTAQEYNLGSNKTQSEWKLIYADVPGIYKLVLSSKTLTELREDKGTSFRHDLTLPFYFEVKSLQEKRLTDANNDLLKRNEELANRNEEIATRSEQINRKMLNYARNTFLASLAMLFVSIVTLWSMPEGKNNFLKFFRVIMIVIGIIMIISLVIAVLILSGQIKIL